MERQLWIIRAHSGVYLGCPIYRVVEENMPHPIEKLKKLVGIPRIGEQIAQRLAAIVESSDDAIASKDLNGIVVTWNRGAERIFGYAAEEIIGKPISMLIPPGHENEESFILDRIQRGERIDHFDTVRRRKDGALIDVSLTVSPIKDEKGTIIGASKIARDVTERKRQEAVINILGREVDHRAKNLLAVVQSMVTLAEGDTPEALKAAISGRIQALANAHNLLAVSHWQTAFVKSMVQYELDPYKSRTLITGPRYAVGARAAQSIAIVLHELATNASKYGALSASSGSVEVEWSLPNQHLSLRWSEVGGPEISPPSREGEGFGLRLIRMMIKNLDGSVQFDWRSAGLVCSIDIPMEQANKTS